MTSSTLERIQGAITAEGLDGWLFFNFHHRDTIADSLLGLSSSVHNTRAWFYFVPGSGEPLRIVHAIESGVLDGLPGEKKSYSGREELLRTLSALAGLKLGAHYSETIAAISRIDYGTVLMLQEAGIELKPADSLIQRLFGILDERGFESHEEAAQALYKIVDLVWKRVADHFHASTRLSEYDVQSWILDYFKQFELETDYPPIVAAGPNAGNPHYEPTIDSRLLARGDVVQLDLWAHAKRKDAIFADISWVGVYDKQTSERVEKSFMDLIQARDAGLSLIRTRLARGEAVSGTEVDAHVRQCLIDRGHLTAIRHRTGHGIDVECHGSGVNLDSFEFPDHRKLIEGSCFSIEPGIYYQDFGLRTEIDVYIHNGAAIVSGGKPQSTLLTC